MTHSSPRRTGSNSCLGTLTGLSISPLKPLMDMPWKIGMCFNEAIKEAFGGAFQTKKCMCATLDSFIQTSATNVITTDTELHVNY